MSERPFFQLQQVINYAPTIVQVINGVKKKMARERGEGERRRESPIPRFRGV